MTQIVKYLELKTPLKKFYIYKDFLIQEVNIEKIIRNIIKKYSKYFISKKIILDLNNLNFKVLSDEKWLYFIFEQLLSNSLKYSSLGDNISIYCKRTKNYLQLRVEDTGCGIKKEDLNRIFNKGFTGNNGRNNSKSTGLGLYLVKELCDKLGHKIDVDSEYNQYTKFTITFKCDLQYLIIDSLFSLTYIQLLIVILYVHPSI